MNDENLNDTQRTQAISREQVEAMVQRSQDSSASLVVVAGWEIGREFALGEEELVLGRSPDLPTAIQHPSVSRRHCTVNQIQEDEKARFQLTDLGSLNGILVNNEHAKEVTLRHGDRIQIGDVVLKYLEQDPTDRAFFRDVHRLIHHDQTTGLLTLESFKRYLEGEISGASESAQFCLSMTDLDGLKKVNDTHGHLAGAMSIREMGRMIREALRDQDIGGLYGGDEAIILYRGAGLEEAGKIAESLRLAIEGCVLDHHGETFSVTISQGIAEWPRHGSSATALIAAADRALYAAKAAGRNCTRTADG
jgi:diguanylate cyclase (GGDEF)-like protein